MTKSKAVITLTAHSCFDNDSFIQHLIDDIEMKVNGYEAEGVHQISVKWAFEHPHYDLERERKEDCRT